MDSLNPTTKALARKALNHYKKKLSRPYPNDVGHCIRQLQRIPVDVSLLEETEIGRAIKLVRRTCHLDEDVVNQAKELLKKWRDVVAKELMEEHYENNKNGATPTSSDERQNYSDDDLFLEEQLIVDEVNPKRESTHKEKNHSRHKSDHDKMKARPKEKSDHSSSSSKHHSSRETQSDRHHSHRHKSKDASSSKSKKSKSDSKAADFESAIAAADKITTHKKHLKPKFKQNSMISIPEESPTLAPFKPPMSILQVPLDLNPNYRPLKKPPSNLPTPSRRVVVRQSSEDEELSNLLLKSKNSKRTAVYSGSKRSAFGETVPSLFDLCIHVLQENVNDIGECGGLPYDILEPVLARASPDCLVTIEEYNPYLVESTDVLWQRFCNRHFSRDKPLNGESWREMFMRKSDELEAKLGMLTVKVQQSYKDVKNNFRKTKLAYVNTIAKPPRNVLRAQAKNGTGLMSHQPVLTKITGPSRASVSLMTHAPSSLRHKTSLAPMMIKTLKLMKGVRTNFRK